MTSNRGLSLFEPEAFGAGGSTSMGVDIWSSREVIRGYRQLSELTFQLRGNFDFNRNQV